MPTYLPGHSYLRAEPLTKEQLGELGVAAVDLLEADLSTATLKELRAVIAAASTKPYGQHRLLWLRSADQAEEAAQNTLLKLLEEPPRLLIVVVEAASADRFLPTVRSRLHLDRGRPISSSVAKQSAHQDLAEFEAALRSADRTEVGKLISQELSYQADQLRRAPSPAVSAAVQLLEKSLLRLEHSANAKLVVDALILRYPLGSGRA